MINFFRNIRQRLLTKNRLGPPERRGRAGKYLLYAIGEIVLVMVGILLALQVNNWNEDRKDRKQEVKLYENLLESLVADSADVMRVQGHFQKGSDALKFVVAKPCETLIDEHSFQELRDSVAMTTYIGYSFFPRYSAYQQITNNGYLDLIQSEEIKSKLAELFDRTYPRYQHIDASMDEKSEFHLEPILRGDLQVMEATSGMQHFEAFDQTLFITHYTAFKRECISILSTSVYAERSLNECNDGIRELLTLIREQLKCADL